jgi:SOUL heme-binding protein
MPAERGAWTIRFFLPAVLMVETAPAPLDPMIHIIAVPPASMAVRRFSGIPRPATVAIERDRLMSGLRASSWIAMGDPVTWFYHPPWTLPWLRRNEVAIEVQRLSRQCPERVRRNPVSECSQNPGK